MPWTWPSLPDAGRTPAIRLRVSLNPPNLIEWRPETRHWRIHISIGGVLSHAHSAAHLIRLRCHSTVTATTAAVIVTQTACQGWLRGYMVRQANQYPILRAVDRVRAEICFRISLERIAVSMHGEQVVAIESIELNYDVRQMTLGGVDRPDRLTGPTCRWNGPRTAHGSSVD